MPPPGYEPFLAMICANPNDDAPRLVYADWLDENGDPERAEFIRLQIELNRIRSPHAEPKTLIERERVLKAKARTVWFEELPKLRDVVWQQFWRGFVNGVDCRQVEALLNHASTIFAATPVTALHLYGLEPLKVRSVVNLPQLRSLTLLYLKGPLHRLTLNNWIQLANSPNLANLEWLFLAEDRQAQGQTLDEDKAKVLAAGTAVLNLQRLFVKGTVNEVTAGLLRDRFGDKVTLF